jgi:hypothetical protein
MEKFNINELNNYTLTNELFMKYTSQNRNELKEKDNNRASNKKIEKTRYITPKQKDQLFWCFYILYKGIDDYNLIEDKHFSIEKQMKIDFVEIIRENKQLLKRYKLRRNEVEDILINENIIDIKVFFMFCIYYEIDIMFINRNFYYELDECFSDNLNIIRIVNGNYCIDTQIENIDFYRNNYCKMDNISRYIKAMSGYKVDELQSMCLKLDINIMNENDKRKTKPEMYDNILLLLA